MQIFNRTMGRVIAKAWSDAAFNSRLLAKPKTALAQLDIVLPAAMSIVARENSASMLHLVTTAKPLAWPRGPLAEIRDFAEIHRDPRLWSLNWLGRDAVATGRMIADPIGELGKINVHPPKGLSVSLLVNTPTLTHLILPPKPKDTHCTPQLLANMSAGCVPATLRFGRLFGRRPYDTLIQILSREAVASPGVPHA